MKVPDEKLRALLDSAPQAGTGWRHYKTGALYWVIGCAITEADQQPVVIYHRQSSDLHFTRPLCEWHDTLMWEGREVPRFTQVK